MAHPATLIFITCLQWWVSIKEWCYSVTLKCKSFYCYLSLYSSRNKWFLLSTNNLPLPVPALSITNNSAATWYYDSHQNTLTYLKENPTSICKFSWLSAKFVILDGDTRTEYDIDDFVQHLRIHTTDTVCPQLNDLFILWCIHSKQWVSSCTVQCHIIDYMGEERTLVIGSFDKLILREKKVYDQICPIRLQNHKN